MRHTFLILTVITFFAGLFVPAAWILSAICFVFAIGSAPPGKRIDGKAKSGGLFGFLIDDIAVAMNTKKCPFCKETILKNAIKCKHCGSDLHSQ